MGIDKGMGLIGKRVKTTKGQSLIEFALLLPLLAVMLFAIIQYGFIFNAYMTLRHGAHVTARTATMAGFNGSTSNLTAIATSAISPMLNAANLQTPVLVNTTVGGLSSSQVTLTYNLPLIVQFVVPNASSGTLTLSANATYRRN